MKIVFMGTPKFAATILEGLFESGENIVAVYTQPDKPVKRSGTPVASPVKEYALSKGLNVYQPVRIRNAEEVELLRSFDADLFVVAAYGQILSKEVLDIPHFFCVNAHGSILPKYRGASPIQRAIANGEEETGVTLMRMDEGIDTGDMIAVSKIPIEKDDDEASVYENKSVLTASGNDFYSAWEGTNTYEQQLGNNATYTPRLNLIAAIDMAVSDDKFNVWKSDNYKGTNRTGIDLVSGQFVTAEVNYGRDIQITAAYYETEAGSLIDSNFAVINFEVGDVRDGKSAFDDGKIYENIQSYNAAQDEKTALQLLDEHEAVRSEQSYYLRGREYKYIEYNGKLYEENQMVSWHPGDDSSVNNKLVRSFDDITYVLDYSVMGDPPQEAYTTDYHTRLRIRAVLHCSPEEASFDITGLSNAGIVSGVDESGNPIQTLTGYWSKTITPKMMGEGGQSELQQENIVVKVYSMKNGSLHWGQKYMRALEALLPGGLNSPQRRSFQSAQDRA